MTARQKKLAEAIEIANWYWPYRNIDDYFYQQWLKAEYRLNELVNRSGELHKKSTRNKTRGVVKTNERRPD